MRRPVVGVRSDIGEEKKKKKEKEKEKEKQSGGVRY